MSWMNVPAVLRTLIAACRAKYAAIPIVPIFVIAGGALTACDDGVFDVEPGTPYVLTMVNGETLPVVLVVSQFGTRVLLSDTIRFLEAGRYERARWLEERDDQAQPESLLREYSTGIIRPAGDAFTLVDDVCADPRSLALCIAPDTIRMVRGGFLLTGPVPPDGIKRFEAR